MAAFEVTTGEVAGTAKTVGGAAVKAGKAVGKAGVSAAKTVKRKVGEITTLPPRKAEKKGKLSEQDVVPIAGAAVLIGAGLYMWLKKPAAVRCGNKVTMGSVTIEYWGPAVDDFYVNWGIRAGFGDFNNGANLLGGKFASGGPFSLPHSSPQKSYIFKPKEEEWTNQPILELDVSWCKPGDWQTYYWVSQGEGTADESKSGKVNIGPKIKISA